MQLITALFHPEKYHELVKKKWWKTILYLLFWVYFVTTVVNLSDAYVNGIKKEDLSQNIPEFVLQDGILQIDGDAYEFMKEDGTLFVKVDTTITDFPENELEGNAMEEIYITKDKISVYLLGKPYYNWSISDLMLDGISKEQLVQFVVVTYWGVALVMILVEGFTFLLQIAMHVLMLVFIVDILAKFMGRRITFGNLYKCGIYASTMGILCQLLKLWFILRGVAYEPEVFYYLSDILTVLYMVQAVIKWQKETIKMENRYR